MQATSNGAAGFQVIELGRVRPWPGNPRKHFDEAALDELAESIKAKGVLQPILVRPVLERQTRQTRLGKHSVSEVVGKAQAYEIAAGERRYRAATLAGLAGIPAVVRALTDQEMLELALTENEQREDVSPLEKADGYGAWIDQGYGTVEDLAARVGKSTGTVRGILKLRQLPAAARKALEKGKGLSASVAQLIGRIPSPKLRQEAAQSLVGMGGEDGPSYRRAKEQIERRWMVELKQAPFSPKDEELLPDAGSCERCPKRTGNNRAEYPDGRADVCTDPECFRRKAQAHQDRLAAAAKAEGKEVLTAKESKKLFSQYNPTQLNHDAPYVDLADGCYDVPGKGGSWRQLLGAAAAEHTVLATDPKGGLHHLIDKKMAKKLLRQKYPAADTAGGAASPAEARWKKEQAAQRRKAELGKEAARKANGLVAAKMAAAFGGVLGLSHEAAMLVQSLAVALADIVWSDSCRLVAKRRGLEPVEGRDHRDSVQDLAASLGTLGDLMGLVAELVAARKSLDWGSGYYGGLSAADKTFWKAWGVDRAKLLKEVEAKKAGKTKAKGKASANGTPAGTAGVITRDTYLIDLLTGSDVSKPGRALEDGGVPTVGLLLERVGAVAKGQSYTSKVYACLREVKGLDVKAAHAIGDALVEAGVIGPDGPSLPGSVG